MLKLGWDVTLCPHTFRHPWAARLRPPNVIYGEHKVSIVTPRASSENHVDDDETNFSTMGWFFFLKYNSIFIYFSLSYLHVNHSFIHFDSLKFLVKKLVLNKKFECNFRKDIASLCFARLYYVHASTLFATTMSVCTVGNF